MNDELQYELTRLLRRINDTISGPEQYPMTQALDGDPQVIRIHDPMDHDEEATNG